jgi:hypothetical protein
MKRTLDLGASLRDGVDPDLAVALLQAVWRKCILLEDLVKTAGAACTCNTPIIPARLLDEVNAAEAQIQVLLRQHDEQWTPADCETKIRSEKRRWMRR